jgi:hypothetical protein
VSQLVRTIFHDRGAANAAVNELTTLGYQATQINVAMNPHIHLQATSWKDGGGTLATQPVAPSTPSPCDSPFLEHQFVQSTTGAKACYSASQRELEAMRSMLE